MSLDAVQKAAQEVSLDVFNRRVIYYSNFKQTNIQTNIDSYHRRSCSINKETSKHSQVR